MNITHILKSVYHWFYNLRKIHGKNNIVIGPVRNLHIHGNNNKIECYSHKIGSVKIFIYGDNHHLIIHKGVIYKKGTIWFEDSNNEIIIGNDTTLEDVNLAVAEHGTHLHIGKDCMFSSDIRVSTTDSHSVIDLNTGLRINPAKNIEIGDHVWIGTKVSINKAVTIGSNSIISSHSVVTHSILKNVLAGGIPAKIIKQSITWDRQRIY